MQHCLWDTAVGNGICMVKTSLLCLLFCFLPSILNLATCNSREPLDHDSGLMLCGKKTAEQLIMIKIALGKVESDGIQQGAQKQAETIFREIICFPRKQAFKSLRLHMFDHMAVTYLWHHPC